MTIQQQQYFQQVLQYLSQQNKSFQFCLDKDLYQNIFPNNIPDGNDRKVIGREFSKQVKNGGIFTINSTSLHISFDYIYSTCSRCGYKDSANKIHYKII